MSAPADTLVRTVAPTFQSAIQAARSFSTNAIAGFWLTYVMRLSPMATPRNVSVPALIAMVMLACGCSTFNHAWREAAKRPTSPNTLEGRWEGSWISEVNGHNGQLLCLMSRYQNGDYAARFRATYLKVLRFSYTVNLRVEEREGDWHFLGEEDLGKLAGGIYHYVGQATPSEFHSTYRCKYDHGTFEMRRVRGNASGAH